MWTHGDNLLFCPLLAVSVGNVKSLCQVSATDMYCICTQLPTQLSFVCFNPGSPHNVRILASLASGVSKCIYTSVLTWGVPQVYRFSFTINRESLDSYIDGVADHTHIHPSSTYSFLKYQLWFARSYFHCGVRVVRPAPRGYHFK